ncbi:hypothetical protein MKX08_003146 [Trichoderma sp. CBMAI-0020]|nr:hypothetical protein MKX08_003146 [Trichoderma sp. CBMAI-0020]
MTWLLESGPRLNNLTTEGQSLIGFALQDVSIMRLLLDAGVDVELPDCDDHTARTIAVGYKKTEIVKLLVDRKANIHHRGAGGWNAITIATSSTTHPDILRTSIEGGVNLCYSHPETDNTPLHFAVAHDAELAKILLDFRKRVDLEKRNNDGRTPGTRAPEAYSVHLVFNLSVTPRLSVVDVWTMPLD